MDMDGGEIPVESGRGVSRVPSSYFSVQGVDHNHGKPKLRIELLQLPDLTLNGRNGSRSHFRTNQKDAISAALAGLAIWVSLDYSTWCNREMSALACGCTTPDQQNV